MNKPTLIQKILCKIGEHNYDFEVNPMQSQLVWIDGQEAWLHTYKCACCGKVRRDITFRCGGCIDEVDESILKDIEEVE